MSKKYSEMTKEEKIRSVQNLPDVAVDLIDGQKRHIAILEELIKNQETMLDMYRAELGLGKRD